MALDELDYALLDTRVAGSVSSRLFLNLLVPIAGEPKNIANVRPHCVNMCRSLACLHLRLFLSLSFWFWFLVRYQPPP